MAMLFCTLLTRLRPQLLTECPKWLHRGLAAVRGPPVTFRQCTQSLCKVWHAMEQSERRRLWVGNIDEKISEYSLLKLLRRHGEIAQFDFLFHKTGPSEGKPRGYCFVSFKTREEAEHAIHALDGKLALSKKLAVKWAHSQTASYKTQEQQIEEDKNTLAPDKLPSSFGGHQSAVAGTSTKKQACKNSNDAKIRAIESKLRQMERASNDFNIVPTYSAASQQPKGKADTKRFKPYDKR